MNARRSSLRSTDGLVTLSAAWDPPVLLQSLAVLYVALLALENLSLGGLGSATAGVGLVLIVVAAGVYVTDPLCVACRVGGRGFLNDRSRPVVVAALLYLSYAILSLAWTWSIALTSGRTVTLAGVIGLVPALAFALPRNARVPMLAFVAALGALALSVLLQGTRSTGVHTATADLDPNDLSGYLTCGVAITLVLLFRTTGWLRFAMAGNALVLSAAVLLTGSRMGALALGTALLAGLVVGLRRLFAGLALGAALILLALVAAETMVRLDSVARALSVTGGISLANTSGRDVIWSSILSRSDDWLPWGIGAGATRMLGEYHGTGTVAHNVWLSVAAETGVIGLALFIVVCATAVWASRRSPYADYCLAMGPVLLVTSLSLSWEYRKLLWVWVAMCLVQVALPAKGAPTCVERESGQPDGASVSSPRRRA